MGKNLDKDLADLRTMAAAKMSPATIATLLQRSRTWVETQMAAASTAVIVAPASCPEAPRKAEPVAVDRAIAAASQPAARQGKPTRPTTGARPDAKSAFTAYFGLDVAHARQLASLYAVTYPRFGVPPAAAAAITEALDAGGVTTSGGGLVLTPAGRAECEEALACAAAETGRAGGSAPRVETSAAAIAKPDMAAAPPAAVAPPVAASPSPEKPDVRPAATVRPALAPVQVPPAADSPPSGAARRLPPAGGDPVRLSYPGRGRPVTADTARFVGWFLRAGWRRATIGALFDLPPEDVGAVIEAFA